MRHDFRHDLPPSPTVTSLRAPAPAALPDAPADADALFDFERVREAAGYARDLLRRRGRTALAVAAAIAALTTAAAFLLPRDYHAEAKILAQRNMVMPALGNPSRTVPRESDEPTKLALEAVMKRDNLEAIIRQTGLMAAWDADRPIAMRLKDRAMALVRGAPSPKEQQDALIGLLGRRMWVQTSEGTVTISVLWPNAQMAYRIVQAAQTNFIEERHGSEVSMIGESIAILEGNVARARRGIDSAVAEFRGRQPTPAPTPAAAPRPAPPNPVLASLQATLRAKRQAIADLAEVHTRRLGELQARMADLRRSYGPAHPEIATTQEAIDALGTESPQLAALRREERELAAQIVARGGVPGVEAAALGTAPPRDASSVLTIRTTPSDPTEQYAESRLRGAMNEYQDLVDRLNAARIELETARAAFKYRYRVLTPVEVPRRPARPKVALVLVGGLMLAAFLGLFAVLAIDVASGRVYQSWQVARFLRLPVVGEVGKP
ncbi:MAG: hypothetical protein ACJ8AO_08930 [Gemmatimonadaceae bacterium]